VQQVHLIVLDLAIRDYIFGREQVRLAIDFFIFYANLFLP
jgi:hypothetical protein